MTDSEASLASAARRLPAGPRDELSRSLVLAADLEGLLDVAYGTFDTPLGTMLAAVTPAGLVRLAYLDVAGQPRETEAQVLAELARRLSPRVLELPARVEGVRDQLADYMQGRRQKFELRLDWSLVSGFSRRVLDVTARIPFGQVSSYRDVAGMAGNPLASRATGNALGRNPIPVIIPCHRVLRSGGGLGGYTGGIDIKRELLRLEGATLYL
ncbi:MAG: methylated-DNA--[protein]-cysteine S-methyltransferase [Candidatus Dormibacteria bacterium]